MHNVSAPITRQISNICLAIDSSQFKNMRETASGTISTAIILN